MIRVMLVDDQALVRGGICSLLSLAESIDVVAQAGDGQQALEQLAAADVDVILMDIRMPVMDGIETVKALQQQAGAPPVIMLTTFDDHQLVLDAIQAGAKGYLLKDVSLETLVDSIKQVAEGSTLIQPAITERVLQGLRNPEVTSAAPAIEPLSEKEKGVLRLMASGYSNREIAQATFKSEGTVKNQVSTILAKLGSRDRTQAVLKAIEWGLLG
ncbi:response regulator transcription factor [Aestuariibacter halophilus]|uniref:Response regulator transcription factor n=1 Tax=Fluctibacter halophilus TaxID=226011 RepID=A0ABS8GDS9_9ALTE|nr:response regulator transcription factor [Aestuariibacter halophilus]MCC2618045.1 response regulator transcription factor [Aestuariibacter halophilus]